MSRSSRSPSVSVPEEVREAIAQAGLEDFVAAANQGVVLKLGVRTLEDLGCVTATMLTEMLAIPPVPALKAARLFSQHCKRDAVDAGTGIRVPADLPTYAGARSQHPIAFLTKFEEKLAAAAIGQRYWTSILIDHAGAQDQVWCRKELSGKPWEVAQKLFVDEMRDADAERSAKTQLRELQSHDFGTVAGFLKKYRKLFQLANLDAEDPDEMFAFKDALTAFDKTYLGNVLDDPAANDITDLESLMRVSKLGKN
jgi:hypothetical protein